MPPLKNEYFFKYTDDGALMVRVIKYTKQICKEDKNNSIESNFVEKVLVNLVYRSIILSDMIQTVCYDVSEGK